MSVLLALALALAVAAFVLWPLWSSSRRRARGGGSAEMLGGSFEAGAAQRADAYVRALCELELDRELGHLSDADYQELARRYELRAAAALRVHERESLELERRIEQAVLALRTHSKGPVCRRIPVSQFTERDGMLRCPSCGATVPAKRFCGECGAVLESSAGGAR
jgi:hypothetical protein